MSSGEQASGRRAIRYAEDKLGVHAAHDHAVASRNRLDEIMTELSTRRDVKRGIEDAIRDREMDLLGGAWADNPDFSATKMENHMRLVKHNDEHLKKCRANLNDVSSDIEGLEYDKALAETDIKIAVSRLVELGGYFNYLAAVKQAETANKSENPEK